MKNFEKGSRNNRIHITASAIGVLLGLAGIFNHGLFEILQGYESTGGYFIEAIGTEHRYWIHGTEGAFTLIRNYLLTGIAAVLTGLAIVIWSLMYLHKKNGSTVFFVLLALLALVGGGIGFIILFLPSWAFATRINKSLNWWVNFLPANWRRILAILWIYFLVATLISWIIVMELGVFGYFPGLNDADAVLNIVFVFLFATVGLACITFICAIAGDIEERRSFIGHK